MTSSSRGPGSITPTGTQGVQGVQGTQGLTGTQLYGVRTTVAPRTQVYGIPDYISSYYQQKIIPRFYSNHSAYNESIYLTNLSSPLWWKIVSDKPWVFVKSEDNLMWFMGNPSPHKRTSPMTPLLHRLCTRAKSQLLYGEDTYGVVWGKHKEILVTKSRHVIKGVLVEKDEDKPNWFIEKELEGLFL